MVHSHLSPHKWHCEGHNLLSPNQGEAVSRQLQVSWALRANAKFLDPLKPLIASKSRTVHRRSSFTFYHPRILPNISLEYGGGGSADSDSQTQTTDLETFFFSLRGSQELPPPLAAIAVGRSRKAWRDHQVARSAPRAWCRRRCQGLRKYASGSSRG